MKRLGGGEGREAPAQAGVTGHRRGERGAAAMELLFCGIFLLMLVAFITQQIHFALDYSHAADQLRYDLLRSARNDELNNNPRIIGSQTITVNLRLSPFLSAYIQQDQSGISHDVTMTAAGGTERDGFGLVGGSYDAANNAGWVNIWQNGLSGLLKIVAMGYLASGIGYRF